MQRLEGVQEQMLETPDRQVSFTDPDARSMAPSGRGSGVVGYNVQASVDTTHHLIATHKVTNTGIDWSQLAPMSKKTKAALELEKLHVLAYNLKRVMSILGVGPLMAAIRAQAMAA